MYICGFEGDPVRNLCYPVIIFQLEKSLTGMYKNTQL